MKPRPLRSAPAALASDDLKPSVTMRPQQDRLQDTTLGNRIGELVDRLFLELDARLLGIGPDPADLDLADSAGPNGTALCGRRRRHGLLAKKRLETAAEP